MLEEHRKTRRKNTDCLYCPYRNYFRPGRGLFTNCDAAYPRLEEGHYHHSATVHGFVSDNDNSRHDIVPGLFYGLPDKVVF